MLIKQVSVFLENKSGKLSEVISILGENGIDISALSMADTADYGVLRVIVDNPEKAEKVLKDQEIIVKVTNVIGVAINDAPGDLAKILKILKNNSLSVEYMYACVGKIENSALVVMKINDPEKALEILSKEHVPTFDVKDIYRV